MHAHLDPLPAGQPTPLPTSLPPDRPSARAGVLAGCLLDATDRSWQLTVTQDDGPWAVEDAWPGPATGATCAAVVEFAGPRSAAQVAADQRAGRERVWPAAQRVAGTVGALVLRGQDGAMAVVSLAVDDAALEAAQEAILSTPLLPDEDPALLVGPDRSTWCRLLDGGLEALLHRAAAPAGAS